MERTKFSINDKKYEFKVVFEENWEARINEMFGI